MWNETLTDFKLIKFIFKKIIIIIRLLLFKKYYYCCFYYYYYYYYYHYIGRVFKVKIKFVWNL